MNSYCNLETLKNAGTMDIASINKFDTQLIRISEAASREIDKYTDRFYYIYEGTIYQDGGANRVVLDWEVQSITSLIIDIDGNNQYPTTSAYSVDINSPTTAPDAFTYPENTYPKTRLEANPFGSYGHLGAGFRKAIKITGTFGYGNDWPGDYKYTAQSTVGSALTSTANTISVTASTAAEFSPGMTLKVGSEQVYINSAPTGSTCPIVRAQNGTTAASATTGTSISIYQYPQAITQACVIQTIKTWKRRESGYATSVGNNITGEYQSFKGLDSDVKEIINQYKRGQRAPRYI